LRLGEVSPLTGPEHPESSPCRRQSGPSARRAARSPTWPRWSPGVCARRARGVASMLGRPRRHRGAPARAPCREGQPGIGPL